MVTSFATNAEKLSHFAPPVVVGFLGQGIFLWIISLANMHNLVSILIRDVTT